MSKPFQFKVSTDKLSSLTSKSQETVDSHLYRQLEVTTMKSQYRNYELAMLSQVLSSKNHKHLSFAKPICTIPLNFYASFYSQPFSHLCLVNINLKQILGCPLQLMQVLSKDDVSKRCHRGAFFIPFSSLDFLRCAYSLLSKAMLPPTCLTPHSPFSCKCFFLFCATFGLEGSLEPFSKSMPSPTLFHKLFIVLPTRIINTLEIGIHQRSFCHCTHIVINSCQNPHLGT